MSEETTALEGATTTFQGLQREDVLEAPPDATLSYGGRELRSWVSGLDCWQTTRTNGGCPIDSTAEVHTHLKKKLYVPSDSEMVFRYEAPRPPNKLITHAGTLHGLLPDGSPNVGYPDYQLEAHGSGIERTIPAELPQGEFLVFVYVRDPQGEVPYHFRVKVE